MNCSRLPKMASAPLNDEFWFSLCCFCLFLPTHFSDLPDNVLFGCHFLLEVFWGITPSTWAKRWQLLYQYFRYLLLFAIVCHINIWEIYKSLPHLYIFPATPYEIIPNIVILVKWNFTYLVIELQCLSVLVLNFQSSYLDHVFVELSR